MYPGFQNRLTFRFSYFALNMFVTVVQIIIQLIGILDLPALFEDIMEIVTPIVQLATELLKLLITVGSALIEKIIPILMAIIKIWFEYIKIIFEIVSWLLLTLFRILRPILNLVVKVVQVVVSIFRIGAVASARMLLSLENNSRQGTTSKKGGKAPSGFSGFYKGGSDSGAFGGLDAGEWIVNELYTAASRDYSLDQYDKMYNSLTYIHNGIMAEDVYHSQDGYYLEPGSTVPDYTRHLYDDEDLYDHEKRTPHGGPLPEKGGRLAEEDFEEMEKEEETIIMDEDSGVQPAPVETKKPMFSQRDLKAWSGLDKSKLSPEEVKNLDHTRLEFLDLLKDDMLPPPADQPSERVDPEEDTEVENHKDEEESLNEFVARFTSYQVKKNPKKKKTDSAGDSSVKKTKKKKNPLHSADPYAEVHPDDHWRIDHSHNMTHAQVFPHLKGKKLKRPDFSSIRRKQTPAQIHEKRKRAVAYAHAIQTAYIKVHKKHIGNGHIHKVFSESFKHLTGHDSVHNWFLKFQSNYISPAHFIYENWPSTHDKGFFKHLWKADPDYETRPPFHLWVEREFKTKNLSREYWQKVEEFSQAKEAGLAHDESNIEQAYGPTTKENAKRAAGRTILMDFFGGLKINLEILYEDNCFTTPRRNILCLPFIPTWWLIPPVNLTSVVLTKDLNDNPACEPVWKSTDCILCWEGVWNTIQEFRFSIYFLDLISIILIFGIFTPRPSEYIGYLGKIFPPLSPIVDMVLIYEPGYFPNGQQWACYFINFFYLYEGFIALLIVYYIIDPLWEWLLRSYRAYQSLIMVYRMRIMERRQAMEMFDEALLGSISASYSILKRKRDHTNWSSYAMPRETMIGDQQQETRVRVEYPTRSESTAEYIKKRRMAEENQREIVQLTRYEMETEKLRKEIAASMDELANSLGAKYSHDNDQSASRKRKAVKVWQFVTSVFQIPFQATPVYTQQLDRHHRRMHEQMAPPGAEQFPSPYESLSNSGTSSLK